MKRQIRSSDSKEPPASLEVLREVPPDIELSLEPAVNRCEIAPRPSVGTNVEVGDVVAEGEHLKIHTAIAGTVTTAGDALVRIEGSGDEKAPAREKIQNPTKDTLPQFAADMGLAGMGGSMFPSSIKFAAAKSVHTLVINVVECEPGIEIDECLLLHDRKPVTAAIEMLQEVLGMTNVILATKRTSMPHVKHALPVPSTKTLCMSGFYPAGAEKLIVHALDHRMPPAGELPVHRGYLVLSVASLWAIGRRLLQGRPSIDRPLTLITPQQPSLNIVVPVGTSVEHVLKTCSISFDPEKEILIAGGLMMGRRVEPGFRIQKGTNALFVHPVPARIRKPEEPCILCGSCFDACPLGLHPIGMADRIKERAHSSALEAHLQQCFLCGACSAVCPSEIPLVQYFHEGKKWLKERT